ncbi:hypothetical protein RFI_40356 [Reticulomyxa filosa]|uniref:Uncharacterized protein n=1 Tax=Reticulomyxa filosa TaxID=46433 RepID=X6L8V5_RETFI|nr:hypothetical protein RFI_40356 [Reticulomyxa filosa]|eukprot:ETN97174.1 hypothetical protein RFI_40356 [Reticulomyxa filosa]
MKSSLVLMVLHVLSAFVVLLNANKTNTRSCSWTSGQTYFNQHGRTNILLVSCDMSLKHSANYMWKLKTWKYDQGPQMCNNVASKSSLQISNIESIQSENEIVRVLQSNFVNNPNQSKNNIQVHNNDRTNKKKMVMKKNKREIIDFVYCVCILFFKKNKNNRLLKICKVELMTSTPPSNRCCNSEYRVWIGDSVCDQLFWSQRGNKQEANHQYYLQPRQIYFQSPFVHTSKI